MSRTIHADTRAALQSGACAWVRLYDIRYPGNGRLRHTDAGVDVVDTSQSPSATYKPSPAILEAGDIVETAEPRANTLTLTLDAVSPAMVGALLSQPVTGWTVVVRGAALDAAGAVIGDPLLRFAGFGSGWGLRAGGAAPRIALEVSSHWAAWQVVRGRLTNSESQQALFSGDLGFDSAGLESGDLKWGSA